MAHNYTLACPGMLGTLVHGGTVVIAGGTTAETVFAAIERERVTAVGATVPLVAKWLDSDQFGRHDLSSLKVFINGGAKLPPELRRRVEDQPGGKDPQAGTARANCATTAVREPLSIGSFREIEFAHMPRPTRTPVPIRSILVANRSEISIRVMRAAAEMGIRTVAVYSNEDRFALHRFKADESYLVGEGCKPIAAYLDIDDIIRIAREAAVDAIHPGYGFLSENPVFAEACESAGMVFIGPRPEVMRTLGNRSRRRIC